MEFTGERFIPEKLKESDETYQEHVERYKFACKYAKGLTVLDVACGAGYGSHMLSKEAKQVYGVDISSEAIQYAKANYASQNINFEVMDIKEIKYPDSFFDVVVSFETIEHISFQEIFLKEIKRVLKPSGILILSTPNIETACDGKQIHTPFHVKELTFQEIIKLLDKFKNIEVYSQKMTYHRRPYKKLRLLSRYANNKLREIIVSWWKDRFFTSQKIPVFFKILLYEYAYKFKVMPYIEKNKYIKPTFFIVVCHA